MLLNLVHLLLLSVIGILLLSVLLSTLYYFPDISVVNASISQIVVAKDITWLLVWVPASSRGKSSTLHLRQISDSRVGQFVHPADMTLHVVPGECIYQQAIVNDVCIYNDSIDKGTQHNVT